MSELEMKLGQALTHARTGLDFFKAFEKIEQVIGAAKRAEARTLQAEKSLEKVEKKIQDANAVEDHRKEELDLALEQLKTRNASARDDLSKTRASMKEEKAKLVLEHDAFVHNIKAEASAMKEQFETAKAEKERTLKELDKQLVRAESKIEALRKEFA